MSVARGFSQNGKSWYTNVTKPQSIFLNFTVNAADTGGVGVTSVKSNGYVEYVFMHTSQTPGKTNGFTNPNPASGYAVVCFKNNFNKYLGLRGHVAAPATNTTTTSTTAGTVYTITALGTATLAQWQAVGLPAGFTPTLGQTFVATASQSIGGSAHVGTAGVPNTFDVSVVGDPDQMVANSSIASNAGAQLVLQFSNLTASGTVAAPVLTMDSYTPAGVITNGTPDTFAGTPAVLTGTNSAPAFTSTAVTAAAAPTAGSIVRLEFVYDGSSDTIDGL